MAMATMTVQSSLNDLDAMLQDLSRVKNGFDLETPPQRPPPPKGYVDGGYASLKVPKSTKAHSDVGSSISSLVTKRPRHPPKLQHILKPDEEHKRKVHDLVKAVPRVDGRIDVPDFPDYDDRPDSRREVGGVTSSYSTLDKSTKEEEKLVLDIPVEAMEEVDAGEAPRGDKSMVIKTDYGELKSKYNYLGFGLWENTEPGEMPPPPRKASPPPPPPKAEPVWYNCTVTTESHKSSKELDDLVQGLDGYGRMRNGKAEVGGESGTAPGCLGDIHEPFDKEDMSEMFRRAFLEQMAASDQDARRLYNCYVCRKQIRGRIITAMSHKFHPECFVCTYCRKEFKDRSFKTGDDGRPYCHLCFEKLLGHFGTAHL